MGPVSLVAGCQHKLDFFSLLHWLFWEREAGYGPVNRSVVVLWIMSGALLLGAVDLFKSVDDFVKGCYVLTV
jgi:hypothetical protein